MKVIAIDVECDVQIIDRYIVFAKNFHVMAIRVDCDFLLVE